MNTTYIRELINKMEGANGRGLSDNKEFFRLVDEFNNIRRQSATINKLDDEILKQKKIHSVLGRVKTRGLEKEKQDAIDNGIDSMSYINRIAHNHDVKHIFDKHLRTTKSAKSSGFIEEANEYIDAVTKSIFNNPSIQVQGFGDYSPKIDEKYLRNFIMGHNTREIVKESPSILPEKEKTKAVIKRVDSIDDKIHEAKEKAKEEQNAPHNPKKGKGIDDKDR